MLNKLFFCVSISMISILGCSKKESFIEKQVSKIVDSLSADKKYSNKLFIVQHQSKWNKDYIKVSTAEFFDKDSATYYTSNNENLIVYYSNFFKIKKEKKNNTDQHDDYIYKEGTISIFHPRYIIFELNKNGNLRKIVNEEDESKLFQYGNTYVPEPVPSN
ncbi:hypothetical protein D3C71_18440 [compost metagenome]